MNSRVVDGFVRHERLSPVAREFSYPLRVLVLDVDELDSLGSGLPLIWGHNRFGLYGLRDADYLDPGPGTLREKLARLLARFGRPESLASEIGQLWLATCPRVAGYVFNPVSFWTAFSKGEGAENGAEGRFLFAVAEVNNTFGEKHVYLLDDPENDDFPLRFRRPKQFHVSPFNDLRGEYAFSLGDPRRGLDVHVDLWRDGAPVMLARLWSESPGRKATPGALLSSFIKHPFLGGLTYARILRQAAGLYLTRRLSVHSKPEPSSDMTLRSPDFQGSAPGFLTSLREESSAALRRALERAVVAFFSSIRRGTLRLTLPDGRVHELTGPEPGPSGELVIHDPAFHARIALGGDIGFGDAYVDGLWSSPDLPRLMELLAANNNGMSLWRGLGLPGADAFDRATAALRRMRVPLGLVGGRRNDRAGARRNIHAHYDLSNEMFELFLDPSMAYSCAWHEELECGLELAQGHEAEMAELERAQAAKFRQIVRKLRLSSRHRLLEIGCGWGGLLIHAVKETGCRAVGLTISPRQRDYVVERVRKEGLSEFIEVRLQDYRDAKPDPAPFDRIVSIEMLEAVGHEYHPVYFRALDRLLAPGGRALVQVITIPEQRYDAYRTSGDWIRKRIFPGGLLPSLGRMMEVTGRHTRLVARDVEDIGRHYARTLAIWRNRFLARREELAGLGFDARFQRAWDYYFSYCLGGFATGAIGDAQIVFERPGETPS